MVNKINVSPTVNMVSDDATGGAGCQDTGQEAYDVYTGSNMYRAMKPLFFTLKLFGLHFTQRFGTVEDCMEQVKCKNMGRPCAVKCQSKRKCTVSQLYSCFVCTILYLFALKNFAVFTYGDLTGSDLFYKMTLFTWTILLAVNVTMFLLASNRYKGFPKFFIEVDGVINQSMCLQGVRKTTWIVTIIALSIWTLFVVVQFYLTLEFPAIYAPLFAPLDLSHPDIDVMRGIVFALSPIVLAAWILPVAVDFLFSYTLYKSFCSWSMEFRQKLSDGSMTTDVFVTERRRHQKLCQLVADVDEFLSVHNAGSLLCNVAIILFILYNLMYVSADFRTPQFYAANLAWFSTVWVNLIITCYSGVMVNGAAHAIYEDLHGVDGQVDVEEIHLFESRLSGSSIGLTALGMFVLNKPAVLGMLSQLLTYFIVIVQFAPGSTNAQGDPCNCSAILTNASLSCTVL